MEIKKLLKEAGKMDASDVHLLSGEPPVFRIYGDIERQSGDIFTDEDIYNVFKEIMTAEQLEIFISDHEIDFALDYPDIARYRVNAFKNTRGFGAVFRIIPNEILPFEKLGLPKEVKNIAEFKQGMVLVTGPTGSGKSTTLASIIDMINNTRKTHIITIEEPIEFIHESKKSLIHHREVGVHTKSYANALRAALREDPDIILVGELRDLETISLALSAAETGALVFGTLHTNGAAKTVNRIIDVFPANQQDQIRSMFADSVAAILSQTLLKRADEKGRIAVLEVLFGNPAIRNMIREKQIHQINSALETSQKHGMQSLDKHLKQLYFDGHITLEDAKRHMNDLHAFEKELAQHPQHV